MCDKKLNKNITIIIKMYYFFKRILYCLGSGLELLSALLEPAECQDSKVFLTRKEPLSMTIELLKSILWLNDHACFAIFDLLAKVFTFLMCSFLLVSKQRPVSPI